jgi:hypothetical protein
MSTLLELEDAVVRDVAEASGETDLAAGMASVVWLGVWCLRQQRRGNRVVALGPDGSGVVLTPRTRPDGRPM